MEILDYLRAKGRLLAVLVLMPVLAGAAAYTLLAGEPERYRGEVRVTVPSALASGVSAVGLYIANFSEAITSGPVVDRAVAETGVPADQVRDGLEVSQVGQANLLAVQFVGEDRGAVSDVARVAAQATLEMLATERVEYERGGLAVAEDQYQRARGEVDAFIAQTGLVFPADDYRAASDRLRELEEQLAEAEALGYQLTANRLRPQIDALRAERDALAPQVLAFQRLEEDLENAGSGRRDANGELLEADAQLALVRSPQLLALASAQALPRGQTLLSGMALAVGAAFLLGVGILVAPDLLRRQRPAAPRPRLEMDGDGWLGVYLADETAPLNAPRGRTSVR